MESMATIKYFNFVNFDLIPWNSVECVTQLDYFDKMVILSFAPVAFLFVAGVCPILFLRIRNFYDLQDNDAFRKERDVTRKRIMKMICFALFLMYPAISAEVLSMYLCRTVNGVSYMIVDFTLYCHGTE